MNESTLTPTASEAILACLGAPFVILLIVLGITACLYAGAGRTRR